MFKDQIEKNISENMKKIKTKELIEAIELDTLEKLLFEGINLVHKKHNPDRTTCEENKEKESANEDEERIVKCLFYKNKENTKKHCEDCPFKDLYNLEGKYTISNYQVPPYYDGKGIGKIDLIINDGSIEYATEIKAHCKEKSETNKESLLRMIAEILTYAYGFPKDKYKPAIAFFEGTPQEIEWINKDELLIKLIEKANISVFLFKEIEKEKRRFTIEKLK